MRVPINWLKEYVDLIVSPEELARQLTMAGIAVENIERFSKTEVVLELELTPNRADCLGLINIAREVAAVTGGRLHLPEIAFPEIEEPIESLAAVEIQAPHLCERYLARVIRNVRIGPSPAWMQERLQAVGIRPINNLVDVTNYVMFETGQPLHAFDYDTVAAHRIIVRPAKPGEKMVTLDNLERELEPEMLVIADAAKAIAIAGVMGGLETEVTEKTRTILLESAHFNRVSIRQTSRRLGLRSESSIRFEKGMDVAGTRLAADRAVQLIAEMGAGSPVAGAVDCYLNPRQPSRIALRVSRTNAMLGTNLSSREMQEILQRLQLSPVAENEDRITVPVPSYRGDLEGEIDLIEEVARLYGYDQIPATLPYGGTTQGIKTERQKAEDQTRRILTACGLNEVITLSMVSPRVFDRFALPPEDPLRRTLVLANPLNEDQSVLRTLLLPNLLEVAARNYSRRVTDLAIFEQGRVFYPRAETSVPVLPEEQLQVAGLTMGDFLPGWSSTPQTMDFFYLKGVVEELLNSLGVSTWRFAAASLGPAFHPGRSAEVFGTEAKLGLLAEIHPDILEEYGIPKRVWAFQINLELVYAEMDRVKRYRGLTRYPSVQRDLALIIPDDLPAAEIEARIRETGYPLLRQVTLFDVYRGKSIAPGRRSLAYSLIYQASDRTLTDDEVNQKQGQVRAALANDRRVELR